MKNAEKSFLLNLVKKRAWGFVITKIFAIAITIGYLIVIIYNNVRTGFNANFILPGEIFTNLDTSLVFVNAFIISAIALSVADYKNYLKDYLNNTQDSRHLGFEEIFENENRKIILESILKSPGIHFSELLRISGLQTGQLEHHLRIMVRRGVISSKKHQNYVVYFPIMAENTISEIELYFAKSDTAYEIFKHIKSHPGITIINVANMLEKSKNTVRYHVKKMEEMDILRSTKQGRSRFLYVSESILLGDFEL